MNRKGLIIFSALCCLIWSTQGCSLAPKYTRPASPVAESWPKGDAYKDSGAVAGEKPAADIPWNEFFVNPKLRKVIDLAITNNRDLRVAALNIEKTQALYRIQRSELFPRVNASAADSVQRIPASLSSTGSAMIARQYSLNVGFSAYELDFFGRIRSLKDKALEQYLATEQAKSSTQISLVSEVAGAWLMLAADKERLRIAKETFAAQEATCDMIKRRFTAGASSELDYRQAQTRVEAARIDIVAYTGKTAQDENALALLVGASVPADLMPEDSGVIDGESNAVKNTAPDLPSSVLLKRPDILMAESQLKSANANIGAARAAFFPRIALTGTYGVASGELSELFKGGPAWSFMPQISIPLFDAGNNKANLKVANIDRDIAVARYEKAIQTAFREVSDALAQSGTVNDRLKAQQALLDATAESFRLSDQRYKGGIDSYLTLLDAQRSLYSAQQAMIDARLLRLSSRVTLYKVLGGGVSAK
jgi:multidrug efflux system outer membrane protein